MKLTAQEYARRVQRAGPHSPLGTDCLWAFGVGGGIERANKVMMPVLFFLFAGLGIYIATLPGAGDGYRYIFVLKPEGLLDPMVWVYALGQAFFSLSVAGNGTLIYGSYLSKEADVPESARTVAFFDSMAAILSALVIIPAMATAGETLTQSGPGLMFIYLPNLFREMPGGRILVAVFFVAALFAGGTSLVNLFEAPTATLQEKLHLSRGTAVAVIGVVGLAVGLCIQGIVSGWMDVCSIYACPIGALQATQDVNLTKDSYLPEYVTWIPTTSYDLQEDATVYDLYTKAIGEAGLRSIGEENDYVRTIYAPSCLGSYALSEFTNGKKSGWMYTVNGKHPNQGLKNWTLNDNDVVVWHYVNDYSHEVADWFNDPQYPSLGNGTYYNDWLRAADISPEQYVNELLGKILKVGKNGTVEPKLTFQHIGKSVTFTFKPDTGYKVKDVKVNGKSVGAVKTYTIDKLTVSTRIEVEFTNGKLPFTDVRESDWFYEDVAFAYENGLFAGTSDTTFSPNASMTRAMLVTVLYRLEGQPAVNGRSGFSDVQYNGYYEDAVTWAADNGIVNGTSTTTFSPNANVTREQMAAILYRYAQHKKYNTAASSGLNGFTDHASVSGYAAASLEWAVAEKLVNGSTGKLMPTGNATRAQVAAILHRFVENVAKTTK